MANVSDPIGYWLLAIFYAGRMVNMSKVKYTKTHEWIAIDGNVGIVGVSDRAQERFGEVEYVELPEVGTEFEQYESAGTIETLEGASFEIHAPVTGEILEVNPSLEDEPDLINRSPEGDGWLFKMSIEIERELDMLMTPDEYEYYDEEEEEELEEEYDDDDDDEEEYY
jgi:glycine cleavage system H protein